jgi:hypothetical protein
VGSERLASSACPDPAHIDLTDLCSMVNCLQEQLISKLNNPTISATASCGADKIDNTYYNGAELTSGTLGDLSLLPYVTTGAYYCALADSHGAQVDGKLSSWFGVESRVDVTSATPATAGTNGEAKIIARRTGTMVLFGVRMKLETQNITWWFPREFDPSTTPPWLGQYMRVRSQGNSWLLNASLTIPIGPVIKVTIAPSFRSGVGARTQTNNAIFFSPERSSNRLSPDYYYATWDTCRQDPNCLKPRSLENTNTLFFEHLQSCLPNVRDFSDGLLPYYGPYGGAGGAGCYFSGAPHDFIYLDTLKNWFKFGKPSADPIATGLGLAPGEPDHRITTTDISDDAHAAETMKNSSLVTNLKTTADIKIPNIVNAIIDANVTLAGRDGFAVRQSHTFDPDRTAGDHFATVWTDLNAQSKSELKLRVRLNFPIFPLIPDIDVPFTIGLGDNFNVEPLVNGRRVVPTSIDYWDNAPSLRPNEPKGFRSYFVSGQAKPNPDQARLDCFLRAQPVTRTAPNPDNPADKIIELATGAADYIHPCNVRICQDSIIEQDYQWDFNKKTLIKVGADKHPCGMCQHVAMDLCTTMAGDTPGTTKEVPIHDPTSSNPDVGIRFLGGPMANPNAPGGLGCVH